MAVIVGIALATGWLYLWLLGHWFARVLCFLALAVVFGWAGFLSIGPGGSKAFGVTLGVLLAWPVSGIPVYVRRWRYARLQAEVAWALAPPPGGFNDAYLVREAVEPLKVVQTGP